jgi:RNA polymerase sigma-70 factor (ECF subfamily)
MFHQATIQTIRLTGAVDTERELVARGLRQRDAEVLRDLVDQYQYRLIRYLIYLLGRRDLVDDVAQDTWLRVVERGKSYDARFPFQVWLFAIARNLAIDQVRRKTGISLDSSAKAGQDEEKSTPAHFLTSDAPSPFELAAQTADAAKLSQFLAKLQPIYREALLLRFQEGLSLKEISITVDAPVATVGSRIQRGLAMLKTHWEGETHAR